MTQETPDSSVTQADAALCVVLFHRLLWIIQSIYPLLQFGVGQMLEPLPVASVIKLSFKFCSIRAGPHTHTMLLYLDLFFMF